jgi:hypothetical protein
MNGSRGAVAALAAAYLLLAPRARGEFTTVHNVPPDIIPRDAIFGANTQINLLQGATADVGDVLYLGGFDAPADNSQLNVLGGYAWAVGAWTGSELHVVAGSVNAANLLGGRGTMSGGFVKVWSLFAESRLEMTGGVAASIFTAGLDSEPAPDAAYFVMSGGEVGVLDATGNVAIQGGTIDNFFFRGAGFVEVSGGSIGDDFEIGSVVVGALPDDPNREIVVGGSGRVTMRGGSIGRRMILRAGRTLDYSGGAIGEGIQVLPGSRFNVRGSRFFIDGVELTWPAGEKLLLLQRDVALEGFLADGQAFRFDLNSEPGHGDYFSSDASIAVMHIPEPRTEMAAMPLMLALAATRLRSLTRLPYGARLRMAPRFRARSLNAPWYTRTP